MKILMLVPQPFFQIRGTPLAILQILRALSGRGHGIDMLTYHVGDDVDIPDVRIRRTVRVPFIRNVRIGASVQKFLLDVIMFFHAFWLLCRNDYDVIHAVEESVFMAVIYKKVFGKKIIYDMDSVISDQLYYTRFVTHRRLLGLVRRMELWAIHNSVAVITVCSALTDEVRRINAGKKVFQVEDIPIDDFEGGQDPEIAGVIRRELDLGMDKVFLYTGNFESYQGVDLFIRAAVYLEKEYPGFCFVLVGGSPEDVEDMRALSRELGVEAHMRFTGRRPVNEMPVFLSLADFLVSPRKKGTNTPLKIYSYMKAGKPIVATDSLTHTQVLNRDNACLVPATAEALAGGMLELLRDPERCARIAAAAQKETDEKYNYRTLEKKINDVYAYVGSVSE